VIVEGYYVTYMAKMFLTALDWLIFLTNIILLSYLVYSLYLYYSYTYSYYYFCA